MSKHAAKCPKCGHRLAYDSGAGDQVTCANCGTSLRVPGKSQPATPTDPLIGQTLGEFEILDVLGRGGMGAVYKARQTSLDRLVAIKVLPQRLASNDSFVERFGREARAAAAISHPNIIEVFAIGQDKGHQFIAMEFIDGETLTDTLKREGRLPPDRALDMLKHVASALAVAHECGIVHRDIKPSNILINQRGLVKVADFGLAKHEGVDVSVTATGAALGTPLYMPPESAQGQPLDARSDLYSLGATFYQALAGKPPFDGTTPAEVAVKHVTTQVPPLQQVAPDVPPALSRVIHRLLRKNPAERYDSADKLLDALARVAQPPSAVGAAATGTLPPDARPATARHSTRRREAVGGTSVPRWLLIAGPIAAAVVLVVILIFALAGKGKQPPPKAAVPAPAPRASSSTRAAPPSQPSKDERNAGIVFKNVQTCIDKKDWQKAKRYLARLTTKYGKTQFAAAHAKHIAALRTQIAAARKPTPAAPKPVTQHPKPPPPPKPEPPPDDDERWTAWEELFDGKTLDGFNVSARRGAKVLVVDGYIKLKAHSAPWSFSPAAPVVTTDYEVEFVTRLLGQGLRLRFPIGPYWNQLEMHKDRVGVTDPDNQPGARGTLGGPGLADAERWYRVRVRVEGVHFWVWVDDACVVDAVVTQKKRESGNLQFFGIRTRALIRSIRLRRLKPEAKAVPWKVYTQWPFDAAEAKRRQAETAKALGVPVEQGIDLGNGVKLTLVLIPAGEFLMGSPPTTNPEKLQQTFGEQVKFYEREFPQHRVTISKPFWLGKTEVTQAQWEAVTGGNPSKFSGRPQNPVEQVSWDDCQEFLQKLRARLAKPFRLPTEAEWEYACRAGSPAELYSGDSETALAQHAWFGANSRRATHPVGQKLPNAWRLYDLYGNVWEWCADGFAPYGKGPQVDPKGPGAGHLRVLRGASWFHRPGHCRSAHRLMGRPTLRPPTHGCRVCVVAVPAPARATPRAAKPPAPAQAPATQGRQADLQAALKPVEAKVTAWDFAGAAALRRNVGGVSVPRDLVEQVARRREEVERMAGLKSKLIERVNTAKPRLRKSSIGLKGINADLLKADEQGITARRADGKAETFAWGDLGADSVRRLVRYTAKTANDHLAAGILLLTLARVAQPPSDVSVLVGGAQTHFAKAKAGGLAIDRYLDPLAAAAFAQAKALLGKKEFKDATESLGAIEREYGKTAWFAAHKDEVSAARARAKGSIADAEAEKLYARAAALFEKRDLWALKLLIEKLKADCPDAKLLTDAARNPTVGEMVEAVGTLGKLITVRKDGKGDFRAIQAALDSAPANSVVEVTDGGVYAEKVVFPGKSVGLTLRGKKGTWPVITSDHPRMQNSKVLVTIRGSRPSLEQFVVSHTKVTGGWHSYAVQCLGSRAATLRRLVLYAGDRHCFQSKSGGTTLEASVLCKGMSDSYGGNVIVRDTLILHGGSLGSHKAGCMYENVLMADSVLIRGERAIQYRSCTIMGVVNLCGEGAIVRDCYARSVAGGKGHTVEHSNVWGGKPLFKGDVKPGKGCMSSEPRFRNPEVFDYRLKPKSPGTGKASDGGDIGVRYTPEMIEVLRKALELRKKGIIKF